MFIAPHYRTLDQNQTSSHDLVEHGLKLANIRERTFLT